MSILDVVSKLSNSVLTSEVGVNLSTNTEKFGLKSYDEIGGSFCLAAGTHDDLPSMFIKVVTDDDPYLLFAQSCLSGDLTGPWFPKVYNVSQVGDTDKWVVVVEKLEVLNLIEYSCPRRATTGFSIINDLDKCSDYVRGIYDAEDIAGVLGKLPDGSLDMLEQLRVLCGRAGSVPDFHSGNIGYRGDQLVWIDPIWNPKTKERHTKYGKPY